MANTKTWPDPDSQIGNQGRKDVMGVYMIDPTTQKATAPSGGGAITNDGTFAKETGGNLAQVVTNTTGLATQTTLAAAKSDLDTIVTQTSGLATAANQTTGNTNTASIVTNTANIPAKGQATMANSTPVTMASDQTPKTAATATRSNVAAATADTSLLASNTARKGAIFYNDSTAILYLAYGAAAASTTSYTVQVPANGYFELPPEPIYTGAIRGIWSAANGNVRITELS